MTVPNSFSKEAPPVRLIPGSGARRAPLPKIVHRYPRYGLKLLHIGQQVNVSALAPDFERLSVDPYVKEGFRHKHIGWFLRTAARICFDGSSADGGRSAQAIGRQAGATDPLIPAALAAFERLPNMPLFQSSEFNPMHGDLARLYPDLVPHDPRTMESLLALFAKHAEVPIGETVLLQYQVR